MQTQNKVCGKCKESRPREAFHKRKDRPDGLQSACKDCHKQRQRTWARPPTEPSPVVISLEPEQSKVMYLEVIARMKTMGIMSDTYAKEALERVNNL